MTDPQHAALMAVLTRIAVALEAQSEPDDEKLVYPLADFERFDWAAIGAQVVQRDEFGVAAIRTDRGRIARRRTNDKYGVEVWFSYGSGRNDDGTPKYTRVIEFREVKAAEPMGRKTEMAIRTAAKGAPQSPAGDKPVATTPDSGPKQPAKTEAPPPAPAPAPAPQPPPSQYDKLQAAVQTIIAAGGPVPAELMPGERDSMAERDAKIAQLSAFANDPKLAEILAARRQLAALVAEAAAAKVPVSPMVADPTGPLEWIMLRIGTVQELLRVGPTSVQDSPELEPEPEPKPMAGSEELMREIREVLTVMATECHTKRMRAPTNARGDIHRAVNAISARHENAIIVGITEKPSLNLVGDAGLCALFRWLRPAAAGQHVTASNTEAVAAIKAVAEAMDREGVNE